MPADGQPANTSDSRPGFPKLKADPDVREDPAKFLARDLVSDDDARRMFEGRVAGIDKLAVVNAWLAVERRLGRGRGGPRDAVIDRLEQRRAFLQEHGERPDDLRDAIERGDAPARYDGWADPEPTASVATWTDRDEEPSAPYMQSVEDHHRRRQGGDSV